MSPWIRMPDGSPCHIRMAKPRTRKCSICGRPSTRLCDGIVSPPASPEAPCNGQVTHKRTCDKPLCDNCAHHVPGKDLDYCGACADKLGVSLIL